MRTLYNSDIIAGNLDRDIAPKIGNIQRNETLLLFKGIASFIFVIQLEDLLDVMTI